MASDKRSLETEEQLSKKTKLDLENLKPSQTLYVKNLNDQIHPSLIKHNLYLIFSTYGDVVQIINNKRGQAHILLDSVANATLALKCLQSEPFFEKALVINYSVNESKLITDLKE